MRDVWFIAAISLVLSACGTARLVPVTYQEPVSVQSVLPVHVRLNTTEVAVQSTTMVVFAGPRANSAVVEGVPDESFDMDDQSIFIDSLKLELVRHGVFGSISERGGKGVVDLDLYFIEIGFDADSGEHRLNVAMAARYRGEVAYFAYDVSSGEGKSDIAEELLTEVMEDVQKFVDDQQISIRAGVKDRNLDISRMLVKW